MNFIFWTFSKYGAKLGDLFETRVVNMRFVKPIDMDEINFHVKIQNLLLR